jgi:hypothetical protein
MEIKGKHKPHMFSGAGILGFQQCLEAKNLFRDPIIELCHCRKGK